MKPEMLVYVLGGVGAGIALLRNVALSISQNINAKAFTEQVIKLLRSDNLDRALKLGRVVETKYFGAGVMRALQTHQAGGAKRTELIRAFEEGLATKRSVILLGNVASVVAGLVALAGLVFGVINAETVAPEAYAAPAIGLVLAFGGFYLTRRMQNDARHQFGRLLEVFGELAKK